LPATERRSAIVEAALVVFTSVSYARATTSEIARAAGVSEPILYRHFGSKRELWLACLDAAWVEMRSLLEDWIALHARAESGSAAGQRAPAESPRLPSLWLHGLSDAADDPSLRNAVRTHMRDVHNTLAGALRKQQAAGGIAPDRDPDAEAWVFVAGALLRSVADRLGGVLGPAELEAIGRERRRWLSGSI
jgi:AcrR family transcriptional regulator